MSTKKLPPKLLLPALRHKTLNQVQQLVYQLDRDHFNVASLNLSPLQQTILVLGFGLASEVGEVLSAIKRSIHSNRKAKRALKMEFGDTLIYLFALMSYCGVGSDESIARAWKKVRNRLKGDYYKYGGNSGRT